MTDEAGTLPLWSATGECREHKWARSVMKSGEVWHICPKCGTRKNGRKPAGNRQEKT